MSSLNFFFQYNQLTSFPRDHQQPYLMSNVFRIKALNKLVSEYYCLHLTPIDYAAAAEQKRIYGGCTLAYYDKNGKLIIRVLKSTDHVGVMKCHAEAGGCLTLFGTCEGMFSGCDSFNQDIGTWDVSGVTNMGLMFCGASSFNQDIGKWDVGQVRIMAWMFYEAFSFNQNIGAWNVARRAITSWMFSHYHENRLPKWYRRRKM